MTSSNETARLEVLHSYDIMDTPAEESFEELVRLAALICGAPIALVSLVDDKRQWFKARIGLEAKETPRDIAFCAHAIEGSEVFVIPDATKDVRFSNNPLVTAPPHIRFYAGAPLITPEGEAIGTLCVIDRRPRELDPEHKAALEILGRHVMVQLELRRRFKDLSEAGRARDVAIQALQQERDKKEAQLQYLTNYSSETGLANRTLFTQRLQRKLHTVSLEHKALAVLLLDFEQFTGIEESLGRSATDLLLTHIAGRLVEFSGSSDRVAHFGADLFALMLPNAEVVTVLAQRLDELLLSAFSKPFEIAGQVLSLSVRIGATIGPNDGKEPTELIANAAVTLKNTKTARAAYAFYRADINSHLAASLAFENRLRRAVETKQFFLHYQPKVNLRDGQLTGLEALLRWNDPEQGMISPAQFIPILERTGLIEEVGRWVMQQATDDYLSWLERGLQPVRIAVNVSPVQLKSAGFLQSTREAIERGHRQALDIEITEGVMMSGLEECSEILAELRRLGAKISIDDFGTGYSSLQYLASLPVDSLKIDRSFIAAMTQSNRDRNIVAGIVSLAQTMSFDVIAEGVETEQQRELLLLLNCDQLQGYLFSPPLPADRIDALLKDNCRAAERNLQLGTIGFQALGEAITKRYAE